MHQTPGGTPLLSPACANNYFPTCSIRWSSIWERRQKQHDNVASALSTHSPGSVKINRNLVGWDENIIWLNICSEMRATKPAFLLCLHSQISGQHTGFLFSVRFPFLSMVFDFFFMILFFVLLVCPLPGSLSGRSDSFTFPWQRANECQQTRSCHFSSEESKTKMQKCCECKIESVTFRTAHFWQFCLPKESDYIEESSEICCSVYKVMFIQYFNITSDFRGCYLNRILYLHVKCQQQFIDIVLPFIIRVFDSIFDLCIT